MQRTLGFCLIILAAFFWAFIGPLARLAMASGVGSMELAFWRAFFGACAFLLHALLTRRLYVPGKTAVIFSAFGVVSVGTLFAVYLRAIEEAGVSLAAILLYTAPAWVALFSRLLFHETISRIKFAALLCAICGAALACASGGGLPQGASTLGIALSLLSGFIYSLTYIFGAYYLRSYSPITMYAWFMPAGALVLLPFVDFVPKTPETWLVLAALGFFSVYAAYWAYCEGLKRLGSTKTSIIATVEPIIAAMLAWAMFGEQFSFSGWTGTALVLTGVLLTVRAK